MTATEVKERPIIMSGPNVSKCLDGSKTQTRRVCKNQPHYSEGHKCWMLPSGRGKYWMNGERTETTNRVTGVTTVAEREVPLPEWLLRHCPYRVGDVLWVKEAWRPVGPWECRDDKATIQYRGDSQYLHRVGWPDSFRIKTSDSRDKWYSPLFMPRWASRLTLEIVSVRVERVQDIGEADAVAEGCTPVISKKIHGWTPCALEFRLSWDVINANRGFPWKSNPWVFAIGFKRVD